MSDSAHIPIYVGYDSREIAAYHTFCQSVIRTATCPVAFHPLDLRLLRDYTETHDDGSNAFIYSRFLIPHMRGYQGWAIFADGDMVLRRDIADLWALRDERYAVQVVQHQYKTKYKWKYVGSNMETHNADYPRKNWSSVILWNCGHEANRVLTPEYVEDSTGRHLHTFQHLTDEQIGALPKEWNWLVGEYEHNPGAKLVHYTLGVPAMKSYSNCDYAKDWFDCFYETHSVEE